ncbi:Hsp20 family protein [Streptomyces sp. NPDC056683]|uniref:Hsp20 family protein n=1 Tax=Streptomyces sp. NPDC056683 TaxID=3345910 RepID=UPI0036D0923D
MDSESNTFVAARLPGVRSEDIDMEINDREPAISGDIKDRERKGVIRHRTRRTGRFEFRVVLPGDVRAERTPRCPTAWSRYPGPRPSRRRPGMWRSRRGIGLRSPGRAPARCPRGTQAGPPATFAHRHVRSSDGSHR